MRFETSEGRSRNDDNKGAGWTDVVRHKKDRDMTLRASDWDCPILKVEDFPDLMDSHDPDVPLRRCSGDARAR